MNCQYCNRLAKSTNSNVQHEIRCHQNPNRIKLVPTYGMLGKKGANQYTYGAIMSATTRKKISDASIIQNKTQWLDPVIKAKHRESMKRIAREKPESYSASNRGRTKQIIVDNIKLQGQWEVDFYLWAKEEGLNPIKPSTGFSYTWNGERTYYPDFYIKSLDLYIEVKGYETDRDRSKWSQFPKNLCIIKEQEIKQIRENSFRAVSLMVKRRTHNSRSASSILARPTRTK